MAMKVNSLEKLFVDTLKDIYDAEHQMIEALPKMQQAAGAPDLKKGFKKHLEVTREHISRLEQIFKIVGQKPERKKCVGMEGLIKEGQQHMTELKHDQDILDVGLIASAQKVEHYEIAGYGTVKSYAEMLGRDEIVRLLDQTLSEECETDERLTTLAESHINSKAL